MRKQKMNESGRSMVEMLGVLAIIGVLSIGAVSGYRWAMDKMAANEILDEVKKRAVVASQQRILGNALDLSEFQGSIDGRYAVVGVDHYDGTYYAFSLSVEGVEKGVCNRLIDMDWMLPVVIELNGRELTETATCSDTNTLLYAFNNDLSIGDPTQSETAPNLPDKDCPTGEYLDLNTQECIKSTCPVGQFLLGADNCVDCPTKSNPFVYLSSLLEDSSCTVCEGAQITFYAYDYRCSYCPKPRVSCGDQCCAEGEICQVTNLNGIPPYYTYTCVSAQCQSDTECRAKDASKPLCDQVTGTCFAGCRENSDCTGENEFCELDSTSISYVQKPNQGSCRSATAIAVEIDDYTKSTIELNWWSADNFCQALQKQLFDFNRLNCYEYGTENKIQGILGYGFCCKKGEKCSYYGTDKNYSDEIEALQKTLGNTDSFWARPLINSHHGWQLGLIQKDIDSTSLGTKLKALCE